RVEELFRDRCHFLTQLGIFAPRCLDNTLGVDLAKPIAKLRAQIILKVLDHREFGLKSHSKLSDTSTACPKAGSTSKGFGFKQRYAAIKVVKRVPISLSKAHGRIPCGFELTNTS